jgi:hypothetical protein
MACRCALRKTSEGGEKHQAHGGADQLHRRHADQAQIDRLIAHRQIDIAGAGAENERGEAAQERGDPDRRHDDGDHRAADQRAQHDALEPEAERSHADDCDQRADPDRCPGRTGGERRDEAREHHELAGREVDCVGRFVDEDEAERDQRVHQTDHHTVCD